MKIKDNLSPITIIYGGLFILALYVAWSFHNQGHPTWILLFPIYFSIIFLIGGVRNLVRKPPHEARWEGFIKEVWAEVVPHHGKVTWPDRKTIYGSTWVVIVTVFLATLYIAMIDLVSSRSIRFLSRFIRDLLGR